MCEEYFLDVHFTAAEMQRCLQHGDTGRPTLSLPCGDTRPVFSHRSILSALCVRWECECYWHRHFVPCLGDIHCNVKVLLKAVFSPYFFLVYLQSLHFTYELWNNLKIQKKFIGQNYRKNVTWLNTGRKSTTLPFFWNIFFSINLYFL